MPGAMHVILTVLLGCYNLGIFLKVSISLRTEHPPQLSVCREDMYVSVWTWLWVEMLTAFKPV